MISAEGKSIGHPALVLACLSLASGCTDVLTFLKLGEVFTSAMTGNAALLGIALSHGEMGAASRSLTALFGFMAGAALAAVIYNLVPAGGSKAGAALKRLLSLELVCLGGCSLLWSSSSDPIKSYSLYSIIVLSALSMGIQGIAAQKISSSGISTIVFTSALIRIVTSLTGTFMHLAGASESRASMKGHLATFAAYACGAALTGLLVSHDMRALIWIPASAVLVALGFSVLPSEQEQGVA